MKWCSILLIIKEMQIKTIVKYHLTPVRVAIIKKTRNNKCWWECGEKGILVLANENVNWYSQFTAWRFLKKLKIELPYDSAIPLLCIYPKELNSVCWRDICMPIFIAALFPNSQDMETAQVSINRWMKKECAFWDNMDKQWGHYAKWNVRQRKTNGIWSHLHVELQNKKQKLIDTEIRFVVTEGRGG